MRSRRSWATPFIRCTAVPSAAGTRALGLDRIEAVGWLGIVPFVFLAMGRGTWGDSEEARRWKVVLIVFALWALGPFLTAAGFDLGLPLPQALARFLPAGRQCADARPRDGLRLSRSRRIDGAAAGGADGGPAQCRSVAQASVLRLAWTLIALLALDYLHAPMPLTALDRPAVYETARRDR